MKYYLICDCRENFKNYTTLQNLSYNDHPSFNNVNEILNALKTLDYDCEYFGGIPEIIHAIDNHMVFPNCRFINFTDGMDQNYSRVQAPALLDILDVPYSGSGVFASVLMNNKHYCKQALLLDDILMPRSCIVNQNLPFESSMIDTWTYPIFVKPNCEGSSIGISSQNVCHTYADLMQIVPDLLNKYREIILEEYIQGIDITNYLIGNPGNYLINDIIVAELYDHSPYAVYGIREKQQKLRKLFFNNEKIDDTICEKIKNTSVLIASTIGANDICRIDYKYNFQEKKYYFLEINSAPRFSSTSEIGFIAAKRGLTFAQILNMYMSAFIQRIEH